MSERTEAEEVALLARQGVEAKEVLPGAIYTFPDGDGGLNIKDTDQYAGQPRRITADRKVSNTESFVAYLARHALPATEVFADAKTSKIVAVIDSHMGADMPGGWQSHKLTLELQHTKSWLSWMEFDGKWQGQVAFAEFVEQRATDVYRPAPGDLMQLAQDFYMTKDVEYQSSQRLSDGQTQLVYKEKVATKGNGQIEVPKELLLTLQPYIGSPRQYAFANFRTRLNGANLEIGYVLVRPEEILDGIFADIVTELEEGRVGVAYVAGIAADPDAGTAAVRAIERVKPFDPIDAPIFYGKPA